MIKRTTSARRAGCLVALFLFSVCFVIASYPKSTWPMGILFGAISLLALLMRSGWLIPFTIAGIYAGFLIDPIGKGGRIDYRATETGYGLAIGTILGAVIGAVLDYKTRAQTEQDSEEEPEIR